VEIWTREERKRILDVRYEDANLFDIHYAEPGYLIYQRGRTNRGTWAIPFSLRDLAPTGDPFLIAPGATYPEISRDGSTLVTIPGGERSNHELVWVGFDGTIGEAIGQPQDAIWDAVLSPDGSKVVVRASDGGEVDLWIHDVRRATKTRLTFSDDVEACPQWSAHGDSIYFCRPAFGRNTRLWRVAADGSGEPEELVPGGFPSLSADGKWIAYERPAEGRKIDLWKWAVDSGEPELFLGTEEKEENASLSPDARWIAYESDESGRDEVYLKSFPSGSGKWQVSVDGGELATWSAEGDRLYFVERNRLFRVDVETDGGLRLSSPTLLLDGTALGVQVTRRVAVAPGDERIVATREVLPANGEPEDRPNGILVVENWLSEFR